VIYIPPNASHSYYGILYSTRLAFICHNPSDIDIVHFLLLGDFNFTNIEWNTLSGQSHISQKFCALIFDIGLDQLINLPTHIKGNTMDLLLTNMEDSIDSIRVHSNPLILPSDHYSITFNLSLCKSPVNQAVYYSYNYFKGNFQGLYDYLSHLNLSNCFLLENIELIWEILELAISNAMRLFIPLTKIHYNHQPSWFNANIRHYIKWLRTLRCMYERHPTSYLEEKIGSFEEKIGSFEESLQEEITNSKINFESYLISEHASHCNSNIIFKYIRNLTQSKSLPSVIHLDDEVAESDADSATCLTIIFTQFSLTQLNH